MSFIFFYPIVYIGNDIDTISDAVHYKHYMFSNFKIINFKLKPTKFLEDSLYIMITIKIQNHLSTKYYEFNMYYNLYLIFNKL